MAALVENKKGIVDTNVTQEQRESMEAKMQRSKRNYAG